MNWIWLIPLAVFVLMIFARMPEEMRRAAYAKAKALIKGRWA